MLLINCLTVWLSNLLFSQARDFPEVGEIIPPARFHGERERFLQALAQSADEKVFAKLSPAAPIVSVESVLQENPDAIISGEERGHRMLGCPQICVVSIGGSGAVSTIDRQRYRIIDRNRGRVVDVAAFLLSGSDTSTGMNVIVLADLSNIEFCRQQMYARLRQFSRSATLGRV